MRVLVAWCPDWPVTAAGHHGREPVAMLEGGRVMCASPAAREAGVRLGSRRREAEGRCGDLIVLPRDLAQEARAYEPVLHAITALSPRVEVLRPGVCALDARAVARYAGGETAVVAQVAELAVGSLPVPTDDPLAAIGVGIADGHFAAALAARRCEIVPAGRSREFLAPFPLHALGRPELADLLARLGIDSLGAFAALDPAAVSARFGPDAVVAHHQARGGEGRPFQPAETPAELTVALELDPPIDRLEIAVSAARPLAGELVGMLEHHGLACLQAAITAETEHGEELTRRWRGEDGAGLGAEAMVQRLHWQLEGWFAGTVGEPAPTAGLSRLVMTAEQVTKAVGVQSGFWGGTSEADRRAARVVDQLQGMLGPGGVLAAMPGGGRGPAERRVLVPWGERTAGVGRGAASSSAPWPGRYPPPAPALVHLDPVPAEVLDGTGAAVTVSARGRLSGEPARLSVGGNPAQTVAGWAGPWLADERWWDPRARRRRARFQLATTAGTAHLCAVEHRRWWVEATYD